MMDTTAGDTPAPEPSDDTEKHYGHIPDRKAWDIALGGDVSTDLDFQVFTGGRAPEARRVEALVRTPEVGLYRARYRAGGGENGLHSPRRLNLAGTGGLCAVLRRKVQASRRPRTGGGVMIPSGATYRFQCTLDSEVVRFAGPPPPPRAQA